MHSGCAATAMPRRRRTYGDAFGQDKQFFAFYRSLQAYRDALNGKDTAFVLSPEGNFFRFFGGVPGAMSTAGGNAAPQSANAPPAPGLRDWDRRRRDRRLALGRRQERRPLRRSRRFGAERRSPRCAPDTVTVGV